MTLRAFLAMGGYAFYVWTSYICVLLTLTVNLIISYYKWRQVKNMVPRVKDE